MSFRSLLNRVTSRRLVVEPLENRLLPAAFSVVMSGLDNPRGLAIGPEGGLYVAEAGSGGSGPCFEPRPGEVNCYGPTGAVSRLWNGQQERIATGLPSLAAPGGTAATGAHDISFQGLGNAYVTVGFGGNPARRSELGDAGAGFGQLVRLLPSGQWTNVTDVAAYESAANPDSGVPDSNPYGILAEPAGRVLTDAGGNSLIQVAANGDVSTLAVFPARASGRSTDSVPTSVVRGSDGAYYVAELTGIPFAVGSANIYRVVPGQAPEVAYAGFTAIIDIAFGPDDSLYVLQHATGPFLSGNGALIRVTPDGTRTMVASEGLVRPTSVLVADDGTIYVSNRGIFAGSGEVIQITAPATVEGVGDRQTTIDAAAFALNPVNDARLAAPTLSEPGGAAVGTSLDANGDGTITGESSDAFFELDGGSDTEGTVDWHDLGRFLSTLRRQPGGLPDLWYMDVNGDDGIDVIEALLFAHRLGTHGE